MLLLPSCLCCLCRNETQRFRTLSCSVPSEFMLCKTSSSCLRRKEPQSFPFRYPKSLLRGPVRHSVFADPRRFPFLPSAVRPWLSTPNGALATRVTPQRNAQAATGPTLHQTCRPSHLECHDHTAAVSVVDSNRVPLLDGWTCKHFKAHPESHEFHTPSPNPVQPDVGTAFRGVGIRCQSLGIVAPCIAFQPPCPCCDWTAGCRVERVTSRVGAVS